jgi:hypothetical protein
MGEIIEVRHREYDSMFKVFYNLYLSLISRSCVFAISEASHDPTSVSEVTSTTWLSSHSESELLPRYSRDLRLSLTTLP